MTSQTETQACCGCVSDAEALEAVKAMTADYVSKGKSLVQILYAAQEMFGSLPTEVQKIVADETGTPLDERVGGRAERIRGEDHFIPLFDAA